MNTETESLKEELRLISLVIKSQPKPPEGWIQEDVRPISLVIKSRPKPPEGWIQEDVRLALEKEASLVNMPSEFRQKFWSTHRETIDTKQEYLCVGCGEKGVCSAVLWLDIDSYPIFLCVKCLKDIPNDVYWFGVNDEEFVKFREREKKNPDTVFLGFHPRYDIHFGQQDLDDIESVGVKNASSSYVTNTNAVLHLNEPNICPFCGRPTGQACRLGITLLYSTTACDDTLCLICFGKWSNLRDVVANIVQMRRKNFAKMDVD